MNQEPDFPAFVPDWMPSTETRQGTSQKRRWEGSLPPGQLSAAEEMHSPREHPDPTGGGRWPEVSRIVRPESLQRDTELLEACQGHFFMALLDRKQAWLPCQEKAALHQSLLREHQRFVLL